MTNQARYKMLFDCMEVAEMSQKDKLQAVSMQIQIRANHITEQSYIKDLTDIKEFAEFTLDRLGL